MPAAPPMMRTSPRRPLWAARTRSGSRGRTLSAPSRVAVACAAGLAAAPEGKASRSSVHNSPHAGASGPVQSPGLSPSRLSVTVARTMASAVTPRSMSRPEGQSTLSTGAAVCAFSEAITAFISGRTGPFKPMPSSASRYRSAGGKRACAARHSAASPVARTSDQAQAASGGKRAIHSSGDSAPQAATTTSRPARCKWQAAIRPSPPLFPAPASATMRRACGKRACTRRATATPARCINAWAGKLLAASVSTCRNARVSNKGKDCLGVTGRNMITSSQEFRTRPLRAAATGG
ncbi:hypothetical protein GALL_508690 [mine drainage metagenome]|uniref:Uncharacterized protein n=1 Tax=mine drainage metagenome TaxID=410659 RepID=A0A1J5P8G8_9ZZZZ